MPVHEMAALSTTWALRGFRRWGSYSRIQAAANHIFRRMVVPPQRQFHSIRSYSLHAPFGLIPSLTRIADARWAIAGWATATDGQAVRTPSPRFVAPTSRESMVSHVHLEPNLCI